MNTTTKRTIAIGVAVVLIATVGGYFLYLQNERQPNEYHYSSEIHDERPGYEKTRDYLVGQIDSEVSAKAYEPFNPDEYKWIKIIVHQHTHANGTDMGLKLYFYNVDVFNKTFMTSWEYRTIPSHSNGTTEWWYLIPQPIGYTGNPIPWEHVNLEYVYASFYSNDTGYVDFHFYTH